MLEKSLASHTDFHKNTLDAPEWTSSYSSQCRGEKVCIKFHHLEHQNKMRWQENTLAKIPSSTWVLLFLFV